PASGCETNRRYFSAARMRCSELLGMSSRPASSSSDRPRDASPMTPRIRSARSTLATVELSMLVTLPPEHIPSDGMIDQIADSSLGYPVDRERSPDRPRGWGIPGSGPPGQVTGTADNAWTSRQAGSDQRRQQRHRAGRRGAVPRGGI